MAYRGYLCNLGAPGLTQTRLRAAVAKRGPRTVAHFLNPWYTQKVKTSSVTIKQSPTHLSEHPTQPLAQIYSPGH